MVYKTEQEAFWAGAFGDDYISRNQATSLEASNTNAFARMFQHTNNIRSILELGANIGMYMRAIRHLMPNVSLNGVEINQKAHEQLKSLPQVTAHHGSILDFNPDTQYDLVFTKGVLIHINPEQLPGIYRKMIALSNRWILLCEYYNPTPQEIKYRGHDSKLFKRDFCGELMELDHSLRLVDYGFLYHRDSIAPQDDLTWFLLEKQ